MSEFDPARSLIIAKFKTVGGHPLPVGTALSITAAPEKPGEIDAAMARRLFASGIAVYAEDYHPTPIESVEAEAARIIAEAADLDEAAGDQIEIQDDLRVSNPALRQIAADEGVAVEGDDNKADLQRKIMEGRAARAAQIEA